jgi:alpha-tubulin suppressor-like RCC1 family protein
MASLTGVQYSGIWNISSQANAKAAGTWPIAVDSGVYGFGINTAGCVFGSTTPILTPTLIDGSGWLTVAAGLYQSGGIKSTGTLWSWGLNNNGQLGIGNTTNYSSPKQVGALTTWSKIAVGFNNILAIKTDGTLWSWGRGSNGQLGLGNTTNYSSPKQIGALTDWATVASAGFQSMATKTNGTLWVWGAQSVLGDTISRSSPVQVGALTNWLTVVAGQYHSGAIKTDGTLWFWGWNQGGCFGIGTSGTYYSSPKQVGALTTWSNMASMTGYTLATKTDGTLWSWGNNFYGNLGLGNTTNYSSPKQVGSGTTWTNVSTSYYSGSIAIKTDNSLWTWGASEQTGQNTAVINFSSPKQIGTGTGWSKPTSGFTHSLVVNG